MTKAKIKCFSGPEISYRRTEPELVALAIEKAADVKFIVRLHRIGNDDSARAQGFFRGWAFSVAMVMRGLGAGVARRTSCLRIKMVCPRR